MEYLWNTFEVADKCLNPHAMEFFFSFQLKRRIKKKGKISKSLDVFYFNFAEIFIHFFIS